MIAFFARQKDYLKATLLFVILIAVAGLTTWATGVNFTGLLIGMALFQACLATMRAEK